MREIKFEISRPAPVKVEQHTIELGLGAESDRQIDKHFGTNYNTSAIKPMAEHQKAKNRYTASKFLNWIKQQAELYAQTIPEQHKQQAREWIDSFVLQERKSGPQHRDQELTIINDHSMHNNFEHGSRLLNLKPSFVMLRGEAIGGIQGFDDSRGNHN